MADLLEMKLNRVRVAADGVTQWHDLDSSADATWANLATAIFPKVTLPITPTQTHTRLHARTTRTLHTRPVHFVHSLGSAGYRPYAQVAVEVEQGLADYKSAISKVDRLKEGCVLR